MHLFPASFVYQSSSCFGLDDHVSDHFLYHFEGSDLLAELLSLVCVVDGIFQSCLGDAYGNSTDYRARSFQGLHSDAEAHAFSADACASRDEAVIENDFRRSRSADAHLVFFFAGGNAGGISIHQEYGEATDAAGFAGICEKGNLICNRRIGDEALRAIQHIAAFHLRRFAGHSACVRAGARFGQGEAGNTAAIQAIEVFLLLLVIAGKENREGRQRIGSAHSRYTGAALAQFFTNQSDRQKVEAGAAKFLRHGQLGHAGLLQNFQKLRIHDAALIDVQRTRSDFLLRNFSSQVHQFLLFGV